MKVLIFVLTIGLVSTNFYVIETRTTLIAMNQRIIELQKRQANLAAGLLELHQKDVYVQEVMNESREQ